MTDAERDHAIASLAQTRERLLSTVSGLAPGQMLYKSAPDRWSIAEILEHVVLVERRILDGIKGALAGPAQSFERAIDDNTLMRRAIDRAEPIKAPDPFIPTGRWPLQQLRPEFESARASTIEFARAATEELRRYSFAHRRFGALDCYQWLLLIPSHGERHRAQAEEFITDEAFSRAAKA